MSERPKDPVPEMAEQLEAAGSLIESLEEEVTTLREDLERANTALRSAREEIKARGRVIEDMEEDEADDTRALRLENSDLKKRYADEQVRLRNEHINELSELRRNLEEQRRADVAAASSDERVETLKEELRREREALEERHRADLEALETSSKEWEEKLREGYREQEDRHREELERALTERDEEREEFERGLREHYEGALNEERRAAAERHESSLAALSDTAEGRELEIQKSYQAVVETQQSEIESLRAEIEDGHRRAREESRQAAREVKKLAEGRERDLKRAHSARLAEVKKEAERRVSGLQAQKEADNRALTARHTEEVARMRREYEERLFTEDERRKQETWALEERLEDLKIQRDAETRTYNSRLKELEASRLALETASQENLERVVAGFGGEVADLEGRISSLEESLEESESLRARLEEELSALRRRFENGHLGALKAALDPSGKEAERTRDEEMEELDARRTLAEERVEALEARLAQTEDEIERRDRELERTRQELSKVSDPERRIRDGIALFNRSEHARAVASISKALGLPKVRVGIGDGTPGKPLLTFIWEEMAWRRYVSDPTEGVEEPRVYLSGTGDDPEDLDGSERRPNARMDSRGRLMLGVQAR